MAMTPELKREVEIMMSGELYQANYNKTLVDQLYRCRDLCRELNTVRPSDVARQEAIVRKLLGKTGKRFVIVQPFYCDYGFNIEIGENFFANYNVVILDEAKVTFGNNVFVAPNCGFYTAGHPLDAALRAEGLEYAKPITVGNDVWIGAHVTVVPGVTIGDRVVIGAGSVVTRDVPSDVVAAGNPCRVIKRINID